MKNIKMKTYFTLLLILLTNLGNAQSLKFMPDYLIRYKFEFQTDSLEVKSKDSEIMNLFIEKNQSLFQSEIKLKFDSIKDAIISTRSQITNFDAIEKPKVWIEVVKDFKNNKLVFSDQVFTYNLIYNNELDKIDWTILNEYKTILGFNTTKAICKFKGRNYTAWFTDKINISDGPFKFSGLPGLILEISDDKNEFNFTALEIKKVKNMKIEKNYNNGIKTNPKDFYKDKIRIMENINSKRNIFNNIKYNPLEK